MARAPRASKGRQKIRMSKMSNDANLAVTFTKRRCTAYKSASELCTLTGAEVALIIFSPGSKAYSFGSPDVYSIIDRYLTDGRPNRDPMAQLHRIMVTENLNQEVARLEKMLEDEKKRGQALDKMINERGGKYWWEAPLDTLQLDQLRELKTRLENLFMVIHAKTSDIYLENCYKPSTDFLVPQCGAPLPLNFDGGISVAGASSSTMPPSNFGVPQEYLFDPSTIEGNVFINSTSLANLMAISTMVGISSSNQMGISNVGASGLNEIVISTTEGGSANQMAISTMAPSNFSQMAVSTLGPSSSNQMGILTMTESSFDQMAFSTAVASNSSEIGATSSNELAIPTIDAIISSSNEMAIPTLGASRPNQMANPEGNEKDPESATVGVLQNAGPSRFDVDSQPIIVDPGFQYGNNPDDDDDDDDDDNYEDGDDDNNDDDDDDDDDDDE